MADLYLAGTFPEPGDAPAETTADAGSSEAGPVDSPASEALIGWWASPVTDLPMRISRDEEDRLSVAIGGRPSRSLASRSDSTLGVRDGPLTIIVPDGSAGEIGAVLVDDGANEPRRYVRAEPPDTTRRALDSYTGWYWSDTLGTTYRVRIAADGRLELHHRRHGTIATRPLHRDAFSYGPASWA